MLFQKKNHGIMSSLRCSNVILSLYVNGDQVEAVQCIRASVFNCFASHFQSGFANCLGIDNLTFDSLNLFESRYLIKPFIHDEVKKAILRAHG